MKILLASSLFSVILAAPFPQDDFEVEEPTLVFVGPSFGGFGDFGRIPGFGQFSGFGDFPSRLPPSFGFENSSPKISISLSDIFGGKPGDQSGGRVPSIINSLFDVLGDHLGVNGAGENTTVTVEGDGEYDHHNNTFEEKVLPDGSVVRVNRTTIKDTDEDGNTFFFSSSVHHVLDDDAETGEEDVDDAETVEDFFPEVDTVSEVTPDNENIDNIEEDEAIGTVDEELRDYEDEAEFVPTDIDESLNEIDFEEEREREAKSEFPGVDDTISVASLFE